MPRKGATLGWAKVFQCEARLARFPLKLYLEIKNLKSTYKFIFELINPKIYL